MRIWWHHYENRFWLHFGERRCICLELSRRHRFAHLYFEIGGNGGDNTISLSLGLWFLTGWLVFSGFHKPGKPNWFYDGRQTGVSIDDNTIRFDVWANKMSWCGDWRKDGIQWRFNILDFLFGEYKYSSRVVESKKISILMPEGNYSWIITLKDDEWRRRRLPFGKKIRRAHAEAIKPIPHPGKGTSSYNCGDDALHGWTGEATSISDAMHKIYTCVMDKRERYPL